MTEVDLMTDRAHSARIYDDLLGGRPDESGEVRRTTEIYAKAGISGRARTHEQVRQLLRGLETPEPGIVPASLWRARPTPFDGEPDRALWAAVARKS